MLEYIVFTLLWAFVVMYVVYVPSKYYQEMSWIRWSQWMGLVFLQVFYGWAGWLIINRVVWHPKLMLVDPDTTLVAAGVLMGITLTFFPGVLAMALIDKIKNDVAWKRFAV